MIDKNIHIGKLVEEAFYKANKENLSKASFAKAIGILPQNLNREFEKKDWSVIKLIMAGRILNYDFSSLFTIDSQNQTQKTKVMLQVEIEESKINDVLKAIEDKNLYKILKR